jgi:hypothetical protein
MQHNYETSNIVRIYFQQFVTFNKINMAYILVAVQTDFNAFKHSFLVSVPIERFQS